MIGELVETPRVGDWIVVREFIEGERDYTEPEGIERVACVRRVQQCWMIGLPCKVLSVAWPFAAVQVAQQGLVALDLRGVNCIAASTEYVMAFLPTGGAR